MGGGGLHAVAARIGTQHHSHGHNDIDHEEREECPSHDTIGKTLRIHLCEDLLNEGVA